MAHHIQHTLLRRLHSLNIDSQPESSSSKEDANHGDAVYRPSPIDIVVVRVMISRAVKLPVDIVDAIFDHAEYWAHSSNEIDYRAEHQSPLRIVGSSSTENKFLLRSFPVGLTGIKGNRVISEVLAYDTNEAKPWPLGKEHLSSYFSKLANYPTPRLARPVRKVVFSMRSKDQGWGGEAAHRRTFKGSWTWFEAGLERFDANQSCDPLCTYDVRHTSQGTTESPLPVCALRPLYPEIRREQGEEEKYHYKHPLHRQQKWEIQRNKTAVREWQDHVVTWSYLDDIKPDSDMAQRLDEEHGRGRETLDGSFVRDLKLGDVITIWGKARFGGWVNHVERVKIDVYWAV